MPKFNWIFTKARGIYEFQKLRHQKKQPQESRITPHIVCEGDIDKWLQTEVEEPVSVKGVCRKLLK